MQHRAEIPTAAWWHPGCSDTVLIQHEEASLKAAVAFIQHAKKSTLTELPGLTAETSLIQVSSTSVLFS